jgi:hypothetical protein
LEGKRNVGTKIFSDLSPDASIKDIELFALVDTKNYRAGEENPRNDAPSVANLSVSDERLHRGEPGAIQNKMSHCGGNWYPPYSKTYPINGIWLLIVITYFPSPFERLT